jgi:formate dehydrogenase subunit gamma
MTVYIKRNTLQARLTHGVAVTSIILLAISGLFIFVPQLAAITPAAVLVFFSTAHRVLGIALMIVLLLSALISPKGAKHFFQSYFCKWDADDKTFMKRFVPYMLSPKKVDLPAQHRVKSGQRVVGWIIFLAGFMICVSGVVLIVGTSGVALSASTMLIMRLIHDIAFILLAVFGLAHIYLGAGFFQPYRGMRKVMFGDGLLNESEALYHWGHWAREEMDRGENVVVVDDGVEPEKA